MSHLELTASDESVYMFQIEPFSAKEGLRQATRLVKLLGPLLAAADTDSEGLDSAVGRLLGQLDENAVLSLCDTLMHTTKVKTPGAEKWQPFNDGTFNLVFAPAKCGYAGMLQWLTWAFKEQFSGFFDVSALGGAFPGLGQMMGTEP